MPIPAYRAKQSTDTSGTGTVVLNAAATNARSFNAAFGASARRVMYAISWATGFELGLGDFDGGSPGSLTRATVLASSNAGALVTLPAGTKDVFAMFDPAAREVISISATATLALADLGNAVVFTGSSAASLNLPAVATAPLGAGWLVMNTGTAALTIDPNGAEQVNGAATLVLQPGASAMLVRLSVAWQAAVISNHSAIGAQLVAAASPTAAHDLLSAPEVDVLSAATTDIGGANSSNVRITLSFTISSFGIAPNGVRRFIRFAAALTLTHNATSLILPGGANITTAAGDTAIAISLGSGNWVVVNYVRADGQPVVSALTGTLRTAAGSAASPSISFSGDSDTGVHNPGANRLGFATNGVAAGEFNGTDFQFNSGYGSVATAFGCRAWVNFNGTGTVAIRASGNVTSITDNGVGDYTVNFTNAMPDANYVCLPIGYSPAGTFPYIPVFSSQTASAIRFVNHAATIGNFDPANVHLAVFR
jgi:hypothetical protein